MCLNSTVKCEVGLQVQRAVIIQNQQNISLTLITKPLNCNILPDMNNSTLINKNFSIVTTWNNIHIPDSDCFCFQVRIQKGEQRTDLCTSIIIDFLCNRLAYEFSSPTPWTQCSILLTDVSSKSPSFTKWWPVCPNQNVSKADSHKEHARLFQMPVRIKCTWECLPAPV